MSEWFYSKAGQEYGPVTTEDLQQRLATREVSWSDHVWRDGMSE